MDRINADLLRTFVEVAKVEHLSRAAEALQADQSTVSRKIARLEQEVGVLLFERIGRNIRLTQAGRRLVGRAERILDDLRDAIAEAEGAVAAESGRVCVAFLHTVGARWLPERLARFLESYPAVRFTLEEGTTAEVMSGVLGGDYDLGILGPPPPRGACSISRSIPSSVSALRWWSRSTTAWSAAARARSRTSPASPSSCRDPE